MKKILFIIASLLFTAGLQAQSVNLATPAGSVEFGTSVTVLPNGNYVVTDPNWTNGTATNVGAVHLYNGQTNALISSLTGSQTGDQVGNSGVIVLTNGNYVVKSYSWDNNSLVDAGAVTWCNGNSGVSGVVSSANSLVGSTAGDYVGGNPGLDGVTALTNGNYVVSSTGWDNGNIIDAGAVTWGNGTSGITGVVSSTNSLVGSTANDFVGEGGITALTNGNYVVSSRFWTNGIIIATGAVTWGNGTSGITGVVSSTNSLVGSTANDFVGGIVIALTNGNYVVGSSQWNNGGSIAMAGAVTWGNGTSGITGVVSISNSLVGSTANDQVGSNSITALTNGNYVVKSYVWDNGTVTNAGAATWGNGNSGVTGVISSSNSLVGSTAEDKVGYDVTALTNGNYVVSSYHWMNGSNGSAGAVTWGNGYSGITGVVSNANSLVGGQANDLVGNAGVTALINGNYVVSSTRWTNGITIAAGAVTWGNGTSGITGLVSISNSLVGSTAGDYVGNRVTALTNGNYVVGSNNWTNGTTKYAGAATWGSGTSGVTGVVSSSNSLVGSTASDYVGSLVTALNNGNYVVSSARWDNDIVTDAGAATWGNGTTGITGEINSTNSLVGSKTKDRVGFEVTSLTDGNYVVSNPYWNNGAIQFTGAITLGNGAAGTSGLITSCNSVLGNVTGGTWNPAYNYNYIYENLIVGKLVENSVTIFAPSQSSLAMVSANASNFIGGNATAAFVDNNCQLIASLKPSGAVPVAGSIAANVYIESNVFIAADGKVYARRHYDISPAAYPNSATSTVTLYYTQAEFDDYNANNGTEPDLPINPTDEDGKLHVSIIQQHGTSATGMADTYSGWTGVGPANVHINPGPSNIIWNNNLLRWEVNFDVTGFSGFFLRGDKNFPLAVQLVNFTAKAESSRNRLDWNTENETQGIIYEVERSVDGNTFGNQGQVSGKDKGASYIFYDENPINGTNYYRLKMTEFSGEASYSNVVLVKRKGISGGISVFPIPADNILHINYSNRALDGSTVTAMDLQGRVMAKATLTTSTQMNIEKWPAGIYMLRFEDGSVMKVVKQ